MFLGLYSIEINKLAWPDPGHEELLEKIRKIAGEMGESQTYVVESLLEYAIEAYEKEKKAGKKRYGKKG